MEIKSVILAAGKGTRMKSNTSKVLHKIFEKPILGYVLDNSKNITTQCAYIELADDPVFRNEFIQQMDFT